MSKFRRRLMGLSALRQAKADDFVRVEYIENTSTAYINTGYKNGATSWRIDAVISLTTANKGGYIIGSRGSSRYFQTIEVTTNPYFETKAHQTTVANSDYTAELNKKYHLVGTPKSLTVSYDDIDEETQETIEQSFTITNSGGLYSNGYELAIFNLRQSVTAQNAFLGRLYGLKLYNASGTLIRDYIPMYQISTDTYGLWDRVEEKFYTSPNRVKFTGGARVVADVNDNLYYIKNYISSNDNINAYITLRQIKNTDKIEFKIYKKRGNDSWFGSRAATPARNHFAVNGYGGGINMNYGSNTPTRIINGVENNKIYTIRIYDREVFLNGKKIYTWGTNTFTSNTSATLGKVDGINNLASNCNWYYFKWWNVNEDLVYDLIPVQSVDSGKYGMFDKVSLVFHPSNGSANFIGG